MFGQTVRKNTDQDLLVTKCLDFFTSIFSDTALAPFAIRLWSDHEWHYGTGPPCFTLKLKHPSALRRMFWRPSELSLGEAFVHDEFEILGDLEACFEVAEHLVSRQWRLPEKLRLLRDMLRLVGRCQTVNGQATLAGRRHSKKRDAQAIRYHYDISNDFYRLWLDRRMVYSCAVFHRQDEDLDAAQVRKLDYICRKLRFKPGEKLLDIGCGWGGLILHAAEKFGVDATGVTISRTQAELAKDLIRQAGLQDRCRVELCDYRDLPSKAGYDKLVSVGMFEHVGESKLPEYFRKAYQLLKPAGTFLNHGITESVSMKRNRGASFIDKYVFPDGELLPISTVLMTAEDAGFEVRDVESLREHYAMTLRHWYHRLEACKQKAIALTSPQTYRIWRIYMAGSAYGFHTQRMGLYQALLSKSGNVPSGLPLTRCDWYRPCPDSRL